MSTRTYCVIPQGARQETSFFQGVFEDGVRVLYQGRLQSLVVSHVLSPAHDYVKHVNGPLLATLRDGGNATLIVATPGTEDAAASAPRPSRSHSPLPPTQGPSTSAAAAPSPDHGAGLAESTAVAMELYASLFPLLFRNLATCAAARVSVVTVSASERVLLDNLRGDRRIRALHEAHRLSVPRDASAAEWGVVLQLLEDRHGAVAESPTALEGQTACVVTVELQGHGRLVVVDVASAQDLLQQLTLILHMHAEGAARTYPLHTPLRDLLERNVAPLATVQVLSVPAPQVTARQSMRVLHFAAAVEAAAAAAAAGPGGVDADRTHSSWTSTTSGRRRRRGAVPVSPAASKRFTSPSPLPTPLEGSHAAEQSRTSDSPAPAAGAAPAPARTSTAHSRLTAESFAATEDGARERTPAQLPPPSVAIDAERQRGREQHLVQRVTALEGQLRESESRCRRAEAALHDAERQHADVSRELRGKESLWADLQRAHQKAKQENAGYAQAVEKLVRQVRTLEREASRQTRQDASTVKQLRAAEAEKEQLSQQLTRLRREVLLFRKDATFRAREATLSRIIPSPASAHAVPAARSQLQGDSRGLSQDATTGDSGGGSGGRHSPRARRLYDSGSDADGAAPASADVPAPPHAQQSRLAAITMDELRWRNTHLEQEVNRLQVRLLSALTAASRPQPSRADACEVCAVMQERVDYFQAELAHVRSEKDALLRLLATSPTSTSPPGPRAGGADADRRDAAAGPTRSVTRSPSPSTDHHSGGGSPALDRHGEGGTGAAAEAAAGSGAGNAQQVAAALLTGCASMDAQLACTQMVLAQRLRHGADPPADADDVVDPASQLSPRILREHQEAVAALAQSLRHIAEKPAARPTADMSATMRPHDSTTRLLLPPVPRCATAADADTLTNYLSFESERCRHLRAFIPTFAQLAVAAEHLAMRLDA